MLELIKGSIFDSKCDLIIIPCNDKGNVSPSVQKELMVNNLPYFNKVSSAGNITFVKNTGGFLMLQWLVMRLPLKQTDTRLQRKI